MFGAKFVKSFVIHKKIFNFVPKKTTKRMKRLLIILFIVLPFGMLRAQTADSVLADTLREVEGKGDSILRVNEAIRRAIGKDKEGRIGYPSVSDVIGARATDKIMHPFAIKDRKREKKHARDRKILEEYEQLTRIKTFEELLDEAIRKQAIEDGKNPPARSGKIK